MSRIELTPKSVGQLHQLRPAPIETSKPDLNINPDYIRDEEWKNDANCKDVDADLFFPELGASTNEAKTICAACKVAEICLEYSLENRQRYGIWGGVAAEPRHEMRMQRKAKSKQKAS